MQVVFFGGCVVLCSEYEHFYLYCRTDPGEGTSFGKVILSSLPPPGLHRDCLREVVVVVGSTLYIALPLECPVNGRMKYVGISTVASTLIVLVCKANQNHVLSHPLSLLRDRARLDFCIANFICCMYVSTCRSVCVGCQSVVTEKVHTPYKVTKPCS